MFKWILVAATQKKRELIAVSLIDVAEIEPIALRLVIGHEACRGGEVKQAIVAVHGAMEFAELGVCYVVALGPHLPHSRHPLEKRERPAHAFAPRRALKTASQELQNDKRGEVECDQRR